MFSSSTGRKKASTRSSTNSNGCVTIPGSLRSSATGRSTSSSSWSPRWTASRKRRLKPIQVTSQDCGRPVDEAEARGIKAAFLKAYRWQYIHSGAQHPHFGKVLSSLITENQGQRIQAALATLQ